MDNIEYYDDYKSKFSYILAEFQNDYESSEIQEYIDLLNNEDIVSSLFKDTAKDILDYSDIYDVDIKLIDDIKILCFLSINIYKIIEKDITYTKKYIVFNAMLRRFSTHLPHNKNSNNKILIKLQYMFKNLSSYSELQRNNGRFGIFQILKSIYNSEKDFFDNKNRKVENDEELREEIREKENEVGEISLKDWVIPDSSEQES